ncbi:MAG: hypothetical protein HGA45_13115 [Chloroflexales bacterium]|nr:hypothetical protein [Chloroflexales bacterium]
MSFEQLKRNRYYEPGLGHAYEHTSLSHYEDLEEYHRPLARMQHAHLHGTGVARGLAVRATAGSTVLTVEAGLAIDRHGRLIVLATNGKGDIGADPPNGESDPRDVPVTLATAGLPAGSYVLSIRHYETLDLNEGAGGRFQEIPWLRLEPVAGDNAYVDAGSAVVLALVEVDAAGKLAALGAGAPPQPHRRLVGLEPGALSFGRTRVGAEGLSDSAGPRIEVQDDGGLSIGGQGGAALRLNPAGGRVGIGVDAPQAGLHIDRGATDDLALLLSASGPGWGSGLQLRNDGAKRTYGIYADATGNLHFADVNARVDRLLIGADGKVGIGGNPPT